MNKANFKNKISETSLKERLDTIELELKKQNSLPRLIKRAIINGIFATFGATIVFGSLIYMTNKMINSSEEIPIINKIIEKTELKTIINEYDKSCK